jgi:hypothetical protein
VDDSVFAASPHSVRAAVSVDDFRQFVFALEDTNVEVMNANFRCFSSLCDKVGFEFSPSVFRRFDRLQISGKRQRWTTVECGCVFGR